jgi:mannose-6-phosphate isomerase-like protein (cupin superfamily)
MPRPGQELTDPVTQARLRFEETSASSGGRSVKMRLRAQAGWSAGPTHVHPRQTERLRVVDGSFRAHVDGEEVLLRPDDELPVPPGKSHTVELIGARGTLDVMFVPALRTDELFETMFAADSPSRPPSFVPSAFRAWVESRGFRDEIRYLWPSRIAIAAAVAAALAFALGWRRVRRSSLDRQAPARGRTGAPGAPGADWRRRRGSGRRR